MDYSSVSFEIAGQPSSTASPAYSFVGLYAKDKKLIFRLPLGYTVPQGEKCYETARDIHITFFKLFQRFRSVVQTDRKRLKKDVQAHEDAAASSQEGREWIVRHDEGDVYYYRHFDVFDSLLDVFDQLAILSLERRLRLTDNAPSDLRRFDRTDAGRVYQHDDTFFDDVAFQPVSTLAVQPSDLVGLYCFLLRDLREHVWGARDPDPLQDDVRVLAEKFESKHLWSTASCWEDKEWHRTRDTLRDKLDLIHHLTALKDDDYYRFYEAVERFLYPPSDAPNKQGILWGLDGFWPVWEWMVLARLVTSEVFKDRLCWIESGNLSPATISGLQGEGFRHPRSDPRVLCKDKGSTDWDSYLGNGNTLGHPYPDAIVEAATLTPKFYLDSGLNWIETLTLQEGPVAMTLTGTVDYLATTIAAPVKACIRTTNPPAASAVDENKLRKTRLQLTGMHEPDLDRPEVCAMLRRVGQWNTAEGAFWQYAPFKSLQDVARKQIGGLMLVDAKYKPTGDSGDDWSADHRKQGAYEDALTISSPTTPAAYSIYICPGEAVTEQSLSTLIAQVTAAEEQFEHEFEREWQAFPETNIYGYNLKNANAPLQLRVLGQSIDMPYGLEQKPKAKKALRERIFPPNVGVSGQRDRNYLSRSLLGVKRFPSNNQFFVKDWPIRDLVDEIINIEPSQRFP